MKTHLFVSGAIGQIRAVAGVATLVGVTLSGLVGCADTHWERAAYQGARYGNDQCQLRRRPTDAPCAELVEYDRYQQERAKARNASGPSTASPAIEEKQL